MDNRAVSTVVSYAMILGIVTLLTAALILSMGGHVENEQERTIRSTLEVVGNDVAADVDAADRIALVGDRPETLELSISLPDRVAGSPYKIEISETADDGRYEIGLRSTHPEVSVTVTVRTRTAIETTTVDGGDLTIAYDTERDTLVVHDG